MVEITDEMEGFENVAVSVYGDRSSDDEEYSSDEDQILHSTGNYKKSREIVDDSYHQAKEAAQRFRKLEAFNFYNIAVISSWARCFDRFFKIYPGMEYLYNRKDPDDRKIPRKNLPFILHRREFYPLWIYTFNMRMFSLLQSYDLIDVRHSRIDDGLKSMYGIYKIVRNNMKKVLVYDMKEILDHEIKQSAEIRNDEDLRERFVNFCLTDSFDPNLYEYHHGSPYYSRVRALYPQLGEAKKRIFCDILVKHYLKRKNDTDYSSCEEVIGDFIIHPEYETTTYSQWSLRPYGMAKKAPI